MENNCVCTIEKGLWGTTLSLVFVSTAYDCMGMTPRTVHLCMNPTCPKVLLRGIGCDIFEVKDVPDGK